MFLVETLFLCCFLSNILKTKFLSQLVEPSAMESKATCDYKKELRVDETIANDISQQMLSIIGAILETAQVINLNSGSNRCCYKCLHCLQVAKKNKLNRMHKFCQNTNLGLPRNVLIKTIYDGRFPARNCLRD